MVSYIIVNISIKLILTLFSLNRGFWQKSLFKRYQRKLVKKLRAKYEPIPFISRRTKNVTLEEHVQNIENMLKEYYLDTDFLNLLIEDNKDDDDGDNDDIKDKDDEIITVK
jgi:hypothetical protein